MFRPFWSHCLVVAFWAVPFLSNIMLFIPLMLFMPSIIEFVNCHSLYVLYTTVHSTVDAFVVCRGARAAAWNGGAAHRPTTAHLPGAQCVHLLVLTIDVVLLVPCPASGGLTCTVNTVLVPFSSVQCRRCLFGAARLHLAGRVPLERIPPEAQFAFSWVVYGAPHPLNANQMIPRAAGVPPGVARSETDVPIAPPGGTWTPVCRRVVLKEEDACLVAGRMLGSTHDQSAFRQTHQQLLPTVRYGTVRYNEALCVQRAARSIGWTRTLSASTSTCSTRRCPTESAPIRESLRSGAPGFLSLVGCNRFEVVPYDECGAVVCIQIVYLICTVLCICSVRPSFQYFQRTTSAAQSSWSTRRRRRALFVRHLTWTRDRNWCVYCWANFDRLQVTLVSCPVMYCTVCTSTVRYCIQCTQYTNARLASQVVFSARGSYAVTPSNRSELNHLVTYSWSLHTVLLGAGASSASASSSDRSASVQRAHSLLQESEARGRPRRQRRSAHEDRVRDGDGDDGDGSEAASGAGSSQRQKLLGQPKQEAQYRVLDETSPVLVLDALSMRAGRYIIRFASHMLCYSSAVRAFCAKFDRSRNYWLILCRVYITVCTVLL